MPYLVRHTKPDIAPGICYGQADLGLAASFAEEALEVSRQLPAHIPQLYYSPLQRCSRLAGFLCDHHRVEQAIAVPDLKEMHFGEWEMAAWDAINPTDLQVWMNDFEHAIVPGGESFALLYRRVAQWWQAHQKTMSQDAVIVAHAGSLRSLLCLLHHTPLSKAFEAYKIAYGQVVSVELPS
jgi:alpha-ribazole phosphatase